MGCKPSVITSLGCWQKQKMKPYAPVMDAKSGSMLLTLLSQGLEAPSMTDTEYTSGFNNGKRYEREALLEYIAHHPDATPEDIAAEIEGRYNSDMRAKLAGIK
jgi:hypothetical protein